MMDIMITYEIEEDENANFHVIGTDMSDRVFPSFHAARKYMMAKSQKQLDQYDYYPGKVAVKEAEDYPNSPEDLGYISDTPNKVKSSGWGPGNSAVDPKAEKIKAEIRRIEEQIAKSTDEDNKAKMTTYVAGLHKALKLIA